MFLEYSEIKVSLKLQYEHAPSRFVYRVPASQVYLHFFYTSKFRFFFVQLLWIPLSPEKTISYMNAPWVTPDFVFDRLARNDIVVQQGDGACFLEQTSGVRSVLASRERECDAIGVTKILCDRQT